MCKFLCYIDFNNVTLKIEFQDDEITEYLQFNGNVDSIDVSINLSESKNNPFDSSTISVKWIFNVRNDGYAQAIGLRIIGRNKTNVTELVKCKKNKGSAANKNTRDCNLLGQSVNSISDNGVFIIKNDKKEINITGNRVPR